MIICSFISVSNATQNHLQSLLYFKMPERKRPLKRVRCRWVDNVKMDRGEIGWGGMDWIDPARDKGLL
jgi:hypothetical protein